MAENIQALIELLGSSILDMDLSHISGAEIVLGNLEHVANFLTLVLEVSVLIKEKRGGAPEAEAETEEEQEAEVEQHPSA